jgi:hypothetical protein
MLARLGRKYRAAGKFQVSGTVCYGPETNRCAARIVSAGKSPGERRIVKV